MMTDLYNNKYRIASARHPHWNYANEGAYFITICTQNRAHYFGYIDEGIMHLNTLGNIVMMEWLKTPALRLDMNITLGAFVVMPNHFHAILIMGANEFNTPDVETHCNASHDNDTNMEPHNDASLRDNNNAAHDNDINMETHDDASLRGNNNASHDNDTNMEPHNDASLRDNNNASDDNDIDMETRNNASDGNDIDVETHNNASDDNHINMETHNNASDDNDINMETHNNASLHNNNKTSPNNDMDIETHCNASLPDENKMDKMEIHNNASLHTSRSMNQFGPQRKNVSSIIRGFKAAVTQFAKINAIPFCWQSRFHDHIIRNQTEYQKIEHYIINNAAHWKADKFYTQ
jgi:REP element-mobilizing transposase RayT